MLDTYATATQLKARMKKVGTEYDAEFADLIEAASRGIDKVCRRPDGFAAGSSTEGESRVFTGSGGTFQSIDECVDVFTVEIKDPDDTDADYVLVPAANWRPVGGSAKHPEYNRTPYTALILLPSGNTDSFTSGKLGSGDSSWPWSSLHEHSSHRQSVPTVRVSADWGYSVLCPPQIREATILQVMRWWKRDEAAGADTTAIMEQGSNRYSRAIDPDIQIMLTGFIREVVG